MKTFKIAVTGGRDHRLTEGESEELYRIILGCLGHPKVSGVVLLHGDCRGVDRDCARYADKWGVQEVPYEAPWDWVKQLTRSNVIPGGTKKPAGPLRNWIMVKAADLLVAFPGGRGTANCIKQARELGVEVVEVGR